MMDTHSQAVGVIAHCHNKLLQGRKVLVRLEEASDREPQLDEVMPPNIGTHTHTQRMLPLSIVSATTYPTLPYDTLPYPTQAAPLNMLSTGAHTVGAQTVGAQTVGGVGPYLSSKIGKRIVYLPHNPHGISNHGLSGVESKKRGRSSSLPSGHKASTSGEKKASKPSKKKKGSGSDGVSSVYSVV